MNPQNADSLFSNALTRLLGIEAPIVLAPFGGLSSVELTARVSGLGGLGSYGLYGYDADRILRTAEELRAATSRPFSFNLWLPTGTERDPESDEYARAVETGATYADLKRSARNAIAFSFLSGAPLWDDPGVYRKPARACAGQVGAADPRPGACADLIARSDKAREQWRHEHLLKVFEAGRK